MSNLKSILLLMLGIAVLVAAHVALRRYGQDAGAPARRSLVESRDGLSRIAIERAGGLSVVLERKGNWRIAAPFAGSVDEQMVAKLLDVLAFTPISDVISESELLKLGRGRADYSLANPLVRISLSGPFGSDVVSFGAPTPSADGVYAALEGIDAVFIVPSEVLLAVDRPADSFRRRSVLPAGTESVSAFAIRRGGGSALSFVRNDEGWSVGGGRASAQKVRKFLSDLSASVVADFVWPVGASNEVDHVSDSLLAGYGLEPESAVTVTLKGDDGVDRQVSFGKSADDKMVYALVQNGGAIVTVPVELRDAAMQDPVMFTDSRLFPVDAQSVGFFSIAEGDTVYAFARDVAGVWRLESPIAAAADAAVADVVLKRILALSSADVSSAGVSVSISTNSSPVMVSRESVLGDHAFEDLRSKEIVRLDPVLVKRIVRTSGEKDAKPVSVIYSRDRKVWNVETAEEGSIVDDRGVASVLATLNPLVATRVEKLKVPAAALDDYGLNHPFLTIAIDQDSEDVVRRNIMLGARTRGGRYATVGSADAVFVISDDVVGSLSAAIIGR